MDLSVGENQLMNVKLSCNIFRDMGDVYVILVCFKTLPIDLCKNNTVAIRDEYLQ